jgi:hypothetical protein
MQLRASIAFIVLMLATLAGCGKPGWARATDQELEGNYVAEFQRVTFDVSGKPNVTRQGKEHLNLSPDKTYVQVFVSPTRQLTNRGVWKSSNDFFGGTEIELVRANVSEDDLPESPPRFGTVFLQVHRERGQLKLARNEAADWYYERVQ